MTIEDRETYMASLVIQIIKDVGTVGVAEESDNEDVSMDKELDKRIAEVEKEDPCAAVCATLAMCGAFGINGLDDRVKALEGPMNRLHRPLLTYEQSIVLIDAYARNCVLYVWRHAHRHTRSDGGFECSVEQLCREARHTAGQLRREWDALLPNRRLRTRIR